MVGVGVDGGEMEEGGGQGKPSTSQCYHWNKEKIDWRLSVQSNGDLAVPSHPTKIIPVNPDSLPV